jgi:hypothetical protein
MSPDLVHDYVGPLLIIVAVLALTVGPAFVMRGMDLS